MEKHSTQIRISVTGPRLAVRRGWWQHFVDSSSDCCQASGISSAISTNSRSMIFFTNLGGSDSAADEVVSPVDMARGRLVIGGTVTDAAMRGTAGMEVVVVVVHGMEAPIGKMGTWVRDVDGKDSPNWSNRGNNDKSQSCPVGMRVLRVIMPSISRRGEACVLVRCRAG